MSKTITVSFGRYNPPSSGHEKLFYKLLEIAANNDSDYAVYPSHTTDSKKNPLTIDQKLKYLEFFFPVIPFGYDEYIRTIFDVLANLDERGYTKVILVAGSDRVPEFKKTITPYVTGERRPKNSEGRAFKNIIAFSVESAGERDPDSDGVEGMSSSKLREFAKAGNYEGFAAGVPSPPDGVDPLEYEETVEAMYHDVRKGLGLE